MRPRLYRTASGAEHTRRYSADFWTLAYQAIDDSGSASVLRFSADEVHDQRNDRDDQEDVNEAPGDVEYEPPEDPQDE
jgi:hypothetical protein